MPGRARPDEGERRTLIHGQKRPEGAGDGFAVEDTEMSAYGAATGFKAMGRQLRETASWLETSDDTDPVQMMNSLCDCNEFRSRKVKGPVVLAWLVLQALGIVYQFTLYCEVSRHLSEFEATLAEHCGPEHQRLGVCVGPSWNLSYSGTLAFPPSAAEGGSDFDFVIPSDAAFEFETRSEPPTFLIGVEPVEPHGDAKWKVGIHARKARRPNNRWLASEGEGTLPQHWGEGSRYVVVTSKHFKSNEWTGWMNLRSSYSDDTSIRLYVLDSSVSHLDQIYKQEQCSFEDSWQNFNERHSGQHHKVLSYAASATAFFLFVACACTALVLRRFLASSNGKLLSRIVMFKFFVQDVPQQLCIICYLYGWYARNGLRCQECLFHPEHCDDENPLHWNNLLVCIFTLASASSNQFLLQAKAMKRDEDDEMCLVCIRMAIFSISVLPFSTALFMLSGSFLHLKSGLVYWMSGAPTFVGWGLICCVPILVCCDD